MFIDPRGRPTVTAGIFARVVCPSVVRSHFSKSRKQSNFPGRIVIATGGTVGLAEWITDDTHVLSIVNLIRFRVLGSFLTK